MNMLNRLLIALALSGASSIVFAQQWDDNHGHDRDDHGHYDRDHHDDHGYHDDRGYHGDHGYRGGPHRWARGGRYNGPVYEVRDYGHYRLRPPPRGYHWVRGDDSNFLLVAVATGVILDIATH